MNISNFMIARQGYNDFMNLDSANRRTKVHDSTDSTKTNKQSNSSVSISEEARLLYEKSRVADFAIKPATPSNSDRDPTLSIHAEGKDFDQQITETLFQVRLFGSKKNDSISIADISHQADQALHFASYQIQSKLVSAGISLTPPVEFSSSANGIYIGSHPSREAIRSLLDKDDVLSQKYRDALIMKANALEWQRAEKAHIDYYASYQSGEVEKAQQIIKNLTSTPAIAVKQNFSSGGIETFICKLVDTLQKNSE